MKFAGIVLCGGRSSRMGRPKAWLPFGVETMLQRVVRILREVVEPVVVVAAPNQDVPALPAGVEIVHDEVEGKGPLAGLAAGLAALEGKADRRSSSGGARNTQQRGRRRSERAPDDHQQHHARTGRRRRPPRHG